MRTPCQRNLVIWTALSLFLVFMLESKSFATTETKLLASDGAAGDDFGISVSISGDVALMGAMGDDDKGVASGSAYFFRWNGSNWVQEQKLLAADGDKWDWFGSSVSISGDVALVGAMGDNDKGDYSGSAYIFRWNGSSWVQEQKILASDGAADDYFGRSVSISGDVALVVGKVHFDSEMGYLADSAYVFRWNGSSWVQEQEILASEGAAEDFFGTSVAISGDVALVGAEADDDKGINSGAAYVFRWNGSSWVKEQKLLAADGDTYNSFGHSVSIGGDVALVGAYWDDDNGVFSGAAYVFRWNGSSWVQEQKLLASGGVIYQYFGCSVSISGDVALVGAHGEGEGHGSAYVFVWNGRNWVEKQKLLASDFDAIAFGYSVSISGDVALVGAYGDNDKGDNSGSAYVFKITDALLANRPMPWIPLLLLGD